ncbi:hypothetical protein CFC21_006399, partial [Triticum aestivum]
MRKQNKKTYPSGIRSSGGQTTLQSFLVKPRVADGELNPYPPPVPQDDEIPNSTPAPPKREIVRVTNKTIREKASAFSSVGSSAKRGADAGALDAAVFKRFNGSSPPAPRAGGGAAAAEAGGDAEDGDGGVRLDVEDIAAGEPPLGVAEAEEPLRGQHEQQRRPRGGARGRPEAEAAAGDEDEGEGKARWPRRGQPWPVQPLRERGRSVAGRAGGRRRRGGRVDRGHVGRHGLHHARRHGVAL